MFLKFEKFLKESTNESLDYEESFTEFIEDMYGEADEDVKYEDFINEVEYLDWPFEPSETFEVSDKKLIAKLKKQIPKMLNQLYNKLYNKWNLQNQFLKFLVQKHHIHLNLYLKI